MLNTILPDKETVFTMSSKMEQIIEEIEEYIDGCKSSADFKNTRFLSIREELEELLAELRTKDTGRGQEISEDYQQ